MKPTSLSRQPSPRTTRPRAEPAPRASGLPLEARTEFVACLRRRFKHDDLAAIMRAAEYAATAHAGQTRLDGAPFITHPLKVAAIASGWGMDSDAVIAALLHDVIEDTTCTSGDIKKAFGDHVAQIVDGITKIEQIEQIETGGPGTEATSPATLSTIKASASFRKLLLAVSKDWRVILIKLADRVHNMRTLGNISRPAKRRRIAQETLDIYAPIAERLGFMDVCAELQELSFKHIHPWRHAVLAAALERSRKTTRGAITVVKRAITKAVRKHGMEVKILAREKNAYSVYRKMIEKQLRFNEVDDIIGFRLLVATRMDCYRTLGVVHELYRPVPAKLKDYISLPKANRYQSIHTTVIDKHGNIIELQLRTKEMNEVAEQGLAAHNVYKDLALLPADQRGSIPRRLRPHTNQILRNILDLANRGGQEGEEFLRNLRLDLFPNEVIVLTPQGKVIELPRNATALDMAYAVHTDIGDRAVGVVIGDKRLPVSASLSSGDIVEIKTGSRVTANAQWLSFVATTKARAHLRALLRETESDSLTSLGRELLDRSLRRLGHDVASVEANLDHYLEQAYPSLTRESLYTEIALGKMTAEIIAREIVGPLQHIAVQDNERSILIDSDNRRGITRAQCCQPLPPEPIVGMMVKHKGLYVHRADCAEVAGLVAAGRHVALNWKVAGAQGTYRVSIDLECTNRAGLIASVLGVFNEESSNIVSVKLDDAASSNQVAIVALVIEVRDAAQLERFHRRLLAMPGVSVTKVRTLPLAD